MIHVAVEFRERTVVRRVRITAESMERALELCDGNYYIVDATVGNAGNEETNVVANAVVPELTNVEVIAYEENPTSADWSVYAYAVCAAAA